MTYSIAQLTSIQKTADGTFANFYVSTDQRITRNRVRRSGNDKYRSSLRTYQNHKHVRITRKSISLMLIKRAQQLGKQVHHAPGSSIAYFGGAA